MKAHPARRAFFVLPFLFVVSCGGGGGGGSLGPIGETLSGLEYADSNPIYGADLPIEPNTPTIRGTPDEFSVEPDLPSGLELDEETGVISGVPTEPAAPAEYAVTATNSSSSVTTTVTIEV